MSRGFEIVDDCHRKHLDVEISIPKRGTSKSAGYDITTPVEFIVPARGESPLIFTDIKAYMMDDEVLSIYVRSSIGIKKGLVMANGTGIIDSDYYSNPDNDGNIGFKLRNLTDKDVLIDAGERVVQGIFTKYLVADDDNAEDRSRTGGLGSTGEK